MFAWLHIHLPLPYSVFLFPPLLSSSFISFPSFVLFFLPRLVLAWSYHFLPFLALTQSGLIFSLLRAHIYILPILYTHVHTHTLTPIPTSTPISTSILVPTFIFKSTHIFIHIFIFIVIFIYIKPTVYPSFHLYLQTPTLLRSRELSFLLPSSLRVGDDPRFIFRRSTSSLL